MSRSSLNGKVVVVTGAARGVGELPAGKLAARGARLALVGLEPDEQAGHRVAGRRRGLLDRGRHRRGRHGAGRR